MRFLSLLALCLWSPRHANVIAWSSLGETGAAKTSRRRDVLHNTAAAAASILVAGPWSSRGAVVEEVPLSTTTNSNSNIVLSNGQIVIPRVGYSLYKTDPSQAETCVQLALQAGVRHLDVATQYMSNAQVGTALLSSSRLLPREQLFVAHKVSNEEQSTNRRVVKRHVKEQLKALCMEYLDLCMVHSPLTSSRRRISTYQALLELQEEGLVRSVGVCNYGVTPLNEIIEAGLPAPVVIQLVLSPFNQHKDVVAWAKSQGSILSCSAWSKLSSVNGPQEGWAVLADIAKQKGMTKAQVLVRWALQSGYLCVPRSASTSKIERQAIVENSYGGVQNFTLTDEEMAILSNLDEQLPAGRLGVVDGWTEQDIASPSWDPTTAI